MFPTVTAPRKVQYVACYGRVFIDLTKNNHLWSINNIAISTYRTFTAVMLGQMESKHTYWKTPLDI
jgi:hypothetical protein